jgi:RhtB (resistance to homoserine/threonine) family protein
MFGTHDLWLFVLSGLLLNIAPGPDTFYILSRTASQGWRGGAVAALGIGGGCFVHIFAAALGLSALLAASATAFTVLKWVGGAYLVWMGIAMLRTPARALEPDANAPQQRLRRVFAQGFATNALNPKVALFFLAFLPQFIAPDAPYKAFSFVFLGCVFNFNATLWNLFVAWSAARIAKHMKDSKAVRMWINRSIGGVFIYLGVRLATVAH